MSRPPWEDGSDHDGRPRERPDDDDPGVPSDRLPDEVHPIDVEVDDRILVYQDGEKAAQGDVVGLDTEAGRHCVTIVNDDGVELECWQRSSRTFYRLEAADE